MKSTVKNSQRSKELRNNDKLKCCVFVLMAKERRVAFFGQPSYKKIIIKKP